LTAFNKPTSGEHQSVRRWLDNVRPVYDEDAEFIDHKEDLVTLRPGREHAWLDASVEKILQCCNCPVIEVSISHYWPCKFAEHCQYLFRSKVGLAYSTALTEVMLKIVTGNEEED
jgi:hypothetical protein